MCESPSCVPCATVGATVWMGSLLSWSCVLRNWGRHQMVSYCRRLERGMCRAPGLNRKVYSKFNNTMRRWEKIGFDSHQTPPNKTDSCSWVAVCLRILPRLCPEILFHLVQRKAWESGLKEFPRKPYLGNIGYNTLFLICDYWQQFQCP